MPYSCPFCSFIKVPVRTYISYTNKNKLLNAYRAEGGALFKVGIIILIKALPILFLLL